MWFCCFLSPCAQCDLVSVCVWLCHCVQCFFVRSRLRSMCVYPAYRLWITLMWIIKDCFLSFSSYSCVFTTPLLLHRIEHSTAHIQSAGGWFVTSWSLYLLTWHWVRNTEFWHNIRANLHSTDNLFFQIQSYDWLSTLRDPIALCVQDVSQLLITVVMMKTHACRQVTSPL